MEQKNGTTIILQQDNVVSSVNNKRQGLSGKLYSSLPTQQMPIGEKHTMTIGILLGSLIHMHIFTLCLQQQVVCERGNQLLVAERENTFFFGLRLF